MSEEYGPTFITLTDEDGNDIELEFIDTLEYNGETYCAFLPTLEEDIPPENLEEDDSYGLIILKRVTENGEELLSTPDSEEELEAVYEEFAKILYDGEEPEE